MAEKLNEEKIKTHKHIMLAFKMDSATNIGLVNIFYSIKDFVFNDNQFTGEDIQKHNENTSDINLLLVKTKTNTDAYIITNINIGTSNISGKIKHIGGQDDLQKYSNSQLIEGIPEMHNYIEDQLNKKLVYDSNIAPVINLYNLINDQNKIYQTLYKPIVFKISSLDISTIVELKPYIYKGDYKVYDGKLFEQVLNKFIEFSYVTFTETDINNVHWKELLNNLGGLSEFQARIEKDKKNYNLYYNNKNPHIVMHITNFIEFISILSKNSRFTTEANRDFYKNFDIAIYRNMKNIFEIIEIIDTEFTDKRIHSIKKKPEASAEDINDILNDKLNQESGNNIITYLKLNNTETVNDKNGNINHAKKRLLYNQRFSLKLNQELYQSGGKTKQKSTLLKLGYNDDEFPYYTCTDNSGSITEKNMDDFRNHPDRFTLFPSGQGIQDLKYKYQYYFGKFQEVFPLYSRSDKPISNQEISSRMDSVKTQLLQGKPVFIIGYGASGAGKTSTLINYKGEDGILIHLCKNLIGQKIGENEFNKLGVFVKEYYVNTEPLVSDEYIFTVNNSNDFTYLSSSQPLTSDNSVKPKHQYRTGNFSLDENTGLGELLVHLVDTDRLVKATTNNPQSSRSHTLVFVKLYNDTNNIGNLIIGDFAGVENKFRCDDTITLQKFLDMPNKDGKPFYSNILNLTNGGGNIVAKDQMHKLIDPDTAQDQIRNDDKFEFENNLTCTLNNITSNEKLYDFKPSNLIYRNTLPEKLQMFKPKEIQNNQSALQKQNKENERARKTLEVSLKQLIPDYPENFKDTKQVYDYLIKPGVKTEINKKQNNMNENFVKIKEIRSKDTGNKKSALLTYLILKHLFFYQDEDVDIGNLEKTMAKYKTTMSPIKTDFRKKKNHPENDRSDATNIKVISGFVLRNKEYPYNTNYTKDLAEHAVPITNKQDEVTSGILNSAMLDTTQTKYHGFTYEKIKKDSYNKYDKSFNGTFNTYDFNNIPNIISLMLTEYEQYYKSYTENPGEKIIMNKRYDFFAFPESINAQTGAKIPVWFQGNIADFAKLFMDKEFSVFKEFLVSRNYTTPTAQLCFILGILDKENTDIDNFQGLVQYMSDIIDETVCRLAHSQFVCDRRLQEGIYINTTLSIIRKTIKHILYEKHQLSNAIMHSPNIIDMCLTSYCPTQQNCFAFEKQDDYVDSKYHNLIDEIHKTLYNDKDKNEFYRDIAICLFGVFNISRCANNPPPIQYIDINRLKQITYSTQEQNTIIQPIFEKLKKDIERFNMQYLNTYKSLTEVLLPIFGINKDDNDKIKINKITTIKDEWKAFPALPPTPANVRQNNPKKIYQRIATDKTNKKPYLVHESRNGENNFNIKDKVNIDTNIERINKNQLLYGPDENGVITYRNSVKPLLPGAKIHDTDIEYAIVADNVPIKQITYSKMTEENATHNGQTIEEIIKDIIDEIDTSNAASAVGVLEFLDQMTKFSTSNTLCYLENDKHDLVNQSDIKSLDSELTTYGKGN